MGIGGGQPIPIPIPPIMGGGNIPGGGGPPKPGGGGPPHIPGGRAGGVEMGIITGGD